MSQEGRRVNDEHRIRVALAGQPNVGKSTLFNALTGLNQHVGNWPGKTIERRIGVAHFNGHVVDIIDLPGTYSLTANSVEELIARDYIIKERPDVVVAIVDASCLERNLYLVAELLPLPALVIVALNMMDVAESEGMRVEPHVLEAALGVPVVPMVAREGKGVKELLVAIDRLVEGKSPYQAEVPQIAEDHREVMEQLRSLVAPYVPEPYPLEWVCMKLLEGDKEVAALMRERVPDENWAKVREILLHHEDAVVALASGRYEWIERLTRAALVRPQVGQISLTRRLDRWATHPFWGLLILLGIVGFIFWLTYALGAPLQGWLDTVVVGGAADLAGAALRGAPDWLAGLVVDGIIGGVGTVLTFLPILVIFFVAFGLVEDVGYMARVAYVMDRFMHLMGLHGKSFLPLFLGFGCNVPSVMGARIVESPRARLLTILLAPLMPCTARMAVLAFLTPIFFGAAAPLVSWGMVGLSLVVLALSGILFNKVLLHGEQVAFIMELPLYHVPNWRTIGLLILQRSRAFLARAGTIILVVSVIIWALSALPTGDIDTSLLATIGHLLEPVGRLMGQSWRMMVALLASFIAKENSIATLGVLFGAGEEEAQLATILSQTLTPMAALAFLVVQMLFIPCVATVATVKQETNSWRWTGFSVAYLLIISLLGGILTYQIAAFLR